MRDFRLDPSDVEDIVSAYGALLARSDIDSSRSGLLGTCVGGAFALMAAVTPRIRDRVRFVAAYAPYASMWTLARDIASASRCVDRAREPWAVDPLTRKVYEHTMTAMLGRADGRLLGPMGVDEADHMLQSLPTELKERLTAMSPLTFVPELRAPVVVLLHDRDDPVIPVSESRTLHRALEAHCDVRYTEFTVFKHLDPTRGNPSPIALTRELFRFARAIYPLFEQAAA
jgi:dienelactone hydrolase